MVDGFSVNSFILALLKPVLRATIDLLTDRFAKISPRLLWELKVAVSSNTYEHDNGKQVDYSQTISGLKELVEEAWTALKLKQKINFQHEYLAMAWKANPYGIKDKKLRQHHTSHLLNHSGKVTVLGRNEVSDFFLVFEDFFQQLDIINWLKLLDYWLEFAEKEPSIVESGHDYLPMETYMQLLRLIEACYLADDFGFCQGYYPPNSNLFYVDYTMQELYSETYDGYNPFLQLSWIFNEYSLTALKEAFCYWMDCAKNKEKVYALNEPAQLVLLHSDVVKLLEIGWLLLYTEEMPEHWLDPKLFTSDSEFSQIHIQEEEYSELSNKEKRKPKKALINYYSKHSWYHYQRMVLNDALYYALQSKTEHHNVHVFIELEKSINKLIEILYLINQKFHTQNLKEF